MKKTTALVAGLGLLSQQAEGHGLLLEPRARSAAEGLTSWGASYWYSQSCTIGCASCNVSFDVKQSQMGGDLCPADHSGDKAASINDPALRTVMGDGCLVPGNASQRAPCTEENKATDWTKFHPWRAPGRAPVYDPCGMAGASPSNNSQAAGGWGYTTGYPQGFPGSRLPALAGDKPVWQAGAVAEVAWVSVANHGGGYQYALCPANDPLNEECFHKTPLQYVDGKQVLRYMYLNDTLPAGHPANNTEVTIDAVRVSEGTVPAGSTWTKNPVPPGILVPAWGGGLGRNGKDPEFTPPPGCDENCWGYEPCDVGFIHPSYEGWNDVNRPANQWVKAGKPVAMEYPACANGTNGVGCCHTTAYMAVVDRVKVPALPAGDYVLRWRWDAEMTPQIWANCADITIAA